MLSRVFMGQKTINRRKSEGALKKSTPSVMRVFFNPDAGSLPLLLMIMKLVFVCNFQVRLII